jgi:hypothetical protein
VVLDFAGHLRTIFAGLRGRGKDCGGFDGEGVGEMDDEVGGARGSAPRCQQYIGYEGVPHTSAAPS